MVLNLNIDNFLINIKKKIGEKNQYDNDIKYLK